MKLMNDNNIVVLALPSHLLQPLDDIPFANLKTEWYKAIRLFMRAHSAQKLAKHEFMGLLAPAWKKAITVCNVQAGFRNTGIWPIDRSKISDDKMAPSMSSKL